MELFKIDAETDKKIISKLMDGKEESKSIIDDLENQLHNKDNELEKKELNLEELSKEYRCLKTNYDGNQKEKNIIYKMGLGCFTISSVNFILYTSILSFTTLI